MIEICNHNECTGCAVCANVCGHSAITISPDRFGFLHPVIDHSLCVDCGLCKKVCPNNSTPVFHKPLNATVGCATDYREQLSSTSGGIASAISRYYTRTGGIVYGCDGSDIFNVHHVRVCSEEDIERLKGSKYVQSNIGNIYKSVLNDLRRGLKVLFIGTPCQISGLLNVTPNKHKDNLLTVDFVCHGVPSQQMLSESIQSCTDYKHNNEVKFRFRIKKWRKSIFSNCGFVTNTDLENVPENAKFSTQYGLFASNNGKLLLNSPFPDNDYIVGFLTGLLYRDSCYTCHYARPERVSDITLGDFHFDNKKHKTLFGENRILSKIIINTEKGKRVINELSDEISLTPIDYNRLLTNNSQLCHPMRPHPKREAFLDDYFKIGVSAIGIVLRKDKIKIKRHLFITKIRNMIYSIPFVYPLLSRLRNGK